VALAEAESATAEETQRQALATSLPVAVVVLAEAAHPLPAAPEALAGQAWQIVIQGRQ